MKITHSVKLTSSTGRTNVQHVDTTLAELEADREGTLAEIGRVAEQELDTRSARNDRDETWTATEITRH
jgi:hypothetical protein